MKLSFIYFSSGQYFPQKMQKNWGVVERGLKVKIKESELEGEEKTVFVSRMFRLYFTRPAVSQYLILTIR